MKTFSLDVYDSIGDIPSIFDEGKGSQYVYNDMHSKHTGKNLILRQRRAVWAYLPPDQPPVQLVQECRPLPAG